MKSTRNGSKRKSMMRKNGLHKEKLRVPVVRAALITLLLLGSCSSRHVVVPDYSEFVSSRSRSAPASVIEIYGNYRAGASGKNVKSSYNLLLEPGRRAYIEIVDPGKQLLYSISLDEKQISLLWAKEKEYIREPASPENLNAILGIPVLPDDLLQLIAGKGIHFEKWEMISKKKHGWIVQRSSYSAELTLQENLSEVEFSSAGVPDLIARYDRYEMQDNQSLPGRIRFEVPSSRIRIELSIDRYVPRTEPPSPELFALQLPPEAKQLSLKEIYQGKPIILQ